MLYPLFCAIGAFLHCAVQYVFFSGYQSAADPRSLSIANKPSPPSSCSSSPSPPNTWLAVAAEAPSCTTSAAAAAEASSSVPPRLLASSLLWLRRTKPARQIANSK